MSQTEEVRRQYAEAARRLAESSATSCEASACRHSGFGADVYAPEVLQATPVAAANASLGCGNPLAVADLHEGEVVLDLGSGGGLDVLLSARRVGPRGKVFGLDMTDEMLELARVNARAAGVANVEFRKGMSEDVPLPDGTVDVVISNCVIGLSADKARVFAEAARVLRPGGRLGLTDVVVDDDVSDDERRRLYDEVCIGTALTQAEYERQLDAAGFEAVEIRETHRVHERAGSVLVRAVKPLS
ncbi:MAG: methyltransferase domain-containing protein [Chloroflexota bacterium]|nr:methyltransferase domain-containing protein [Chloroflexota bacterium]